MDITPLIVPTAQRIERYGVHGFTVTGVDYDDSILILPDSTVHWPDASLSNFQTALDTLMPYADGIDILLVGTGLRFAQLAPVMRTMLRAKNIATDVMDTGAACRTYNVLLAEGRQVAAALIKI